MKYYFVYLNEEDGKMHRKSFDDICKAVHWRMTWCNNYASLRFQMTRTKLEKSLDVKVDTIQKAEELFDNLVADARERSRIMTEQEMKVYLHDIAQRLKG